MANFSQSQTVSGLGTITINIPSAGRYGIDGKITLPRIASGDSSNSSVVVTISQTGAGVIYTGQADAQGFHINPFCAASDVISIVLSSAATIDNQLNVIKTTVSVSEDV